MANVAGLRPANAADSASVSNGCNAKILIPCISFIHPVSKHHMARHLPSLSSLKAFEAAGRHLSFTLAAQELGVTQAAVSHQIKGLENHLGTPLFNRQPRHLVLTKSGARLLSTVSKALDEIAVSIKDIRATLSRRALQVRIPPTFAAKWLSPRLPGFREQFPDIELKINHSNERVDFSRQDFDLAVTYGTGNWPDVEVREVLRLDFFPVCAPSHVKAASPLSRFDDLAQYNLLHDSSYENWERWLALAGVSSVDPRRGTVLDDTNVLMQAAIDGQGVALCSSVFVKEHLDSGRLIRPFDLALDIDLAYYTVCPPAHLKRSEVRAFQDWLLENAAS